MPTILLHKRMGACFKSTHMPTLCGYINIGIDASGFRKHQVTQILIIVSLVGKNIFLLSPSLYDRLKFISVEVTKGSGTKVVAFFVRLHAHSRLPFLKLLLP